MTKELTPREGDIIFCTTPDGVHIEVFFQNETFWLSQNKMAELFSVGVTTINDHLKNIFDTKELAEDSVIRKIRIAQKKGILNVGGEVDFYTAFANRALLVA